MPNHHRLSMSISVGWTLNTGRISSLAIILNGNCNYQKLHKARISQRMAETVPRIALRRRRTVKFLTKLARAPRVNKLRPLTRNSLQRSSWRSANTMKKTNRNWPRRQRVRPSRTAYLIQAMSSWSKRQKMICRLSLPESWVRDQKSKCRQKAF